MASVVILVLGWALLRLSGESCPPGCLCASDILSCSAQDLEEVPYSVPISTTILDLSHNRLSRLEEGGFSGLPRLDTLRLSYNWLTRVPPGTFRNASHGLRSLDLSSNKLQVVEQHSFLELQGLEELLLFDNRIVRVESQALAELGGLHRLYLSHNRLTDFPFFSLGERSHPFLYTLDLSSNRLSWLPLADVAALPAWEQGGLFLHNNTLACDCGLYAMFRRWERKGLASVLEYQEQHTCVVHGERRALLHFLRHSRFFLNCSLGVGQEERGSLRVDAGDPLLLDCIVSMRGPHLSYAWVSPSREYASPPDVLSNGSLRIWLAREEDSGLYLCTARDRLGQRNETHEVNVTVTPVGSGRHSQNETFNTGFTTLLGCLVTLLLVLLYLFLTPCPCRGHRRPPPSLPPPIALSPVSETSGPHTTPEGRKSTNHKHVAFLEPVREMQNGRLRAFTGRPSMP